MANKMTDSTARDLRREVPGVVMGAARGHSRVRVCPRDWLFLATRLLFPSIEFGRYLHDAYGPLFAALDSDRYWQASSRIDVRLAHKLFSTTADKMRIIHILTTKK